MNPRPALLPLLALLGCGEAPPPGSGKDAVITGHASAATGDFAPLYAATLLIGGDLAEQMSGALHYSVTCAEDVPRIESAERQQLAATRVATLAPVAPAVRTARVVQAQRRAQGHDLPRGAAAHA